jgi:hypothetical protein
MNRLWRLCVRSTYDKIYSYQTTNLWAENLHDIAGVVFFTDVRFLEYQAKEVLEWQKRNVKYQL